MTVHNHASGAVPPLPFFVSFLGRVRHLYLPIMRLLNVITQDQDQAAALTLEVFVSAARQGRREEAVSTTAVFREALKLVRIPSSDRGRTHNRHREARRAVLQHDRQTGRLLAFSGSLE